METFGNDHIGGDLMISDSQRNILLGQIEEIRPKRHYPQVSMMREYSNRKPGIIKKIMKEGKSIHQKHRPWKLNNPDISYYPKVVQY